MTASISDQWSIDADLGLRFKSKFKERSQQLLRAGVSYWPKSNLKVHLGIANMGFYRENRLDRNEYRVYEELVLKNKFNKFQLKHRLRIEERYFLSTDHEILRDQGEFNMRYIYLIKVFVPIWQPQDSRRIHQLGLILSEEIFLNSGRNIQYNHIDQNRVVGGLAMKLNSPWSFELAYQNHFIVRNEPQTYHMKHIVWLSSKFRFSL